MIDTDPHHARARHNDALNTRPARAVLLALVLLDCLIIAVMCAAVAYALVHGYGLGG